MTVFLNPTRVPDRGELRWAVRWILDRLQSEGHLLRLPHVQGIGRLREMVLLRCNAAHNREVVAGLRALLLRLDCIHEERGQVWVKRLGLPAVPAWQFYAWMPL